MALPYGCFCLTPGAVGAGQAKELPYSALAFSISAGLPSDVARIVIQTSDGFLWIGSEAGLVRFDGVRFKTFRTADTPGLSGNSIRALHEDGEGNLWIGSDGGLSRYRHGTFDHWTEIRTAVTGFAESASGNTWMCTSGQGIWELKDGDLISHAGDWLVPEVASTRRIFVDSRGRIWLGFQRRGLAYIEDGLFKLQAGAGLDFPQVEQFFEDTDGTIWAGTVGGAYRFDQDTIERVWFGDPEAPKPANGIVSDQRGRLWILSDSLYRSEPGDHKTFERIAVDGAESCTSLIEDREENYWVGTIGGGIVRLRESAFEILSGEAGVVPENVRTVSVDKLGNIWAGISNGGVVKITPGEPVETIEAGSDAGSDIWSVCAASNGDLWIGSRGPLVLLRKGERKEFPSMRNVRVIHEDFEGNIWFGPERGGVYVQRDGSLVSLAGVIGGPTSTVSAFANGPDQSLFIAMRTGEGLLQLKKGRVFSAAALEGFPDDEVGAVYADAEGNVWLGTKHRGLAVRYEGKWHNPDKLSEPFKESISAIAEDDVGKIWIGTPRGISWGDKRKIIEFALNGATDGTSPFRALEPGDGIPSSEMGWGNQPAVARNTSGRMFFATKSGVVAVRPDGIRKNSVKPQVKIERIAADDRDLDLDNQIRIPAGTRRIEIDYTAIGFVRPEWISCRYRLAGFDSGWTEAGEQRVAYFTNLPPGDYRFQVIAGNDDGFWNEEGASISFKQMPQFNQTWWFYGSTTLLVLCLIYVLYRIRTANLHREKQKLENRVSERTEELVRAQQEAEDAMRIKVNFLNNMSHELRTPLNGVLGMCDLLLGTSLDDDQRDFGKTIQTSANSLLDIVKDILEYSQNEADRPKIAHAQFNPEIMVEDAIESLAPEAHRKGLDLMFSPVDGLPLPAEVFGDSRRIRQVLTNLLNNAIKFTRHGEIVVKLGFQPEASGPGFLRCEIRDTGIGMNQEGIRRIFKTFSQVDGSLTRSYGGTGIGLAISKQLVEMMGGKIGVESLPGSGSMFWFSVQVESRSETFMQTGSHAFLKGRRIMVAGCSRTQTAILANALKWWGATFQAEAVGNSLITSLESLGNREQFPAGIILDAQMDGFELAAQIRGIPGLAETAIVVIGTERPAENRQLIDAHNLLAVQKPVRMSVLRQVIEHHINRVGSDLPDTVSGSRP